MPIDLHFDQHYVTMVLLGLVTPDQIIDAFEAIQAEFDNRPAGYIIMEITEMIYQPTVMFAEAVQISRRNLVEHPNILGVVYILATNHPLRDTFTAVYASHGLSNKLFFALNTEEAHHLFQA